jgi:D-sedoheptulose 7-phosphate isomerase
MARVAGLMPFATLEAAAELLLGCYRDGGTIFVLGNGGSAATASHLACDLAKNTRATGLPPFRVLALTDNVPQLTAWANDHSFACVFAEQLRALMRPGDLVLAISASGNSPNVVAAVEYARANGATTLALTSQNGGQLRALADLAVHVPTDDIELVEDAHMVIAHSLCVALRAQLHALDSAPLALALGR